MKLKNVNNDTIQAIIDGANVTIQPGGVFYTDEVEGMKCRQEKGCIEVPELKPVEAEVVSEEVTPTEAIPIETVTAEETPEEPVTEENPETEAQAETPEETKGNSKKKKKK